jgi:F-type H+-transporting ATPase subunit gamma
MRVALESPIRNPQSAIRNPIMPSIQDLRRRLRAVKSTQQITKAMKMVAAARLRRAQERVQAARPYTQKMMQILGDLARRAPDFKHPLLTGREMTDETAARTRRIILALVTADKGLCGAFNTNLIKAANEFIRQHAGEQIELVLIGRKGNDYFHRRNLPIRRAHLGITGSGRVNATDAISIGQQLVADFTNEDNPVDAIYLLYGEFKSALVQRPALEQLLPIGRLPEGEQVEAGGDYIYEQPASEIFEVLLPKLVENQLYHALLESVASEMGSRMTAMDSASKNAGEVIDRLTLNMNRVRQAAITREIIEVVSGAEAL